MESPDERRPTTPRFDDIDVLRGLSILAVILLHIYLALYYAAGFSIRPRFPRWLFHLPFTNGGNGVTVFFAVSGFLITLTSLRRFGSLAHMRPAAFYRIRFARIAPLLLLLLAVLSVLHLCHVDAFRIPADRATLPRALFAALTFHVNWLEAVHGFLPANWDILWSLSIEEMFYLFFPLVCVGLLRIRFGQPIFIALLIGFAAMGPFARTVWTANPIWQEKSYLGGMDGIALGCLCALITDRFMKGGYLDRKHAANTLLILKFAGAVCIALIAIWPRWHWMNFLGNTGLDGTVLSLGTCLVMASSVLRGQPGRSWIAPVRWFGRHSYEVYLTHEFIVVWGIAIYLRVRRLPLSLWILAIIFLSAALGAAVARFFSEPLNRNLRSSSRTVAITAR
jgi:peptidoglycan/LPS O-acetylase OafA/YrhL